MSKFKILDCTLRDGGYYTDWFFSEPLVRRYFHAIAEAPVDQIELGYLNPLKPGASGPYWYLGKQELEMARSLLPKDKKIAVMMNYKDVSASIADNLMKSVPGLVDIVRFACPPSAVKECIEIAKVIRGHGAEVAINIMYLSKYINNAAAIVSPLATAAEEVQYVSLVDSYGSCFPEDVAKAIKETKSILPQLIGFHGHDNISLAFANALSAIEAGADFVDSTILGMGRGAGNLRTELISAYKCKGQSNVSMNAMAECIHDFEKLKHEYDWGSNLPYVISGLNELPQADVMDWLGTRRYKISSIVSALQGAELESAIDTIALPKLVDSSFGMGHTSRPLIIIGGGRSVVEHQHALISLAEKTNAVIVLSSLRHASLFSKTSAPVVSCLAGQEAQLRQPLPPQANRCFVVGENPRLKESLPAGVQSYSVTDWTKKEIKLGPVSDVAPLELALGAAIDLKASAIYLAGFDGFAHASLADQANSEEVQSHLALFAEDATRPSIQAITPTLYKVDQTPLYGHLSKAVSGV